MKLSIINGSPRGKSSNTRILMEKIQEGFNSVDTSFEFEEAYIKSEKDKKRLIKMFETSDILIIGFPLYTDAMPGIVKELFEALNPKTIKNDLRLGFVVQSGFSESYHSEFIKAYLEKLCRRLKAEYIGTAIKGGVEGIKVQPKWITKKYLSLFYDLGQQLALDWVLDENTIERLSQPEHLTGSRLMLTKFFIRTGLANFYWNSQLKTNKAFEKRFAKPYLK